VTGPGDRKFTGFLGSILAIALGLGLVVSVRGRLLQSYVRLGESDDITALPGPEQLDVFSLGYRSALADYLFATTLVRAGRYFAQKRNYIELPNYLDAIVHLDPRFRAVYHYGDSLLTLNTVTPPPGNYRRARNLVERGLEQFPSDPDLWLSAAQFMLYLAPPWLPPGEDKNEWKARGAKILQRACELRPDDPPVGCVSSLKTLAELGEAEASMSALKRMLALSDDPEFRAKLETRLAELSSVTEGARITDRSRKLARTRALDLPLATRTEYQIAGPAYSGLECLADASGPCVTAFRDSERAD
jgi:tetratricopeptide (TPR) repeat protein